VSLEISLLLTEPRRKSHDQTNGACVETARRANFLIELSDLAKKEIQRTHPETESQTTKLVALAEVCALRLLSG